MEGYYYWSWMKMMEKLKNLEMDLTSSFVALKENWAANVDSTVLQPLDYSNLFLMVSQVGSFCLL